MNGVEYVPTDEQRDYVRGMVRCGVKQEIIATVLSIDPKTLRKHFREDLDFGMLHANAQVANSLFKRAIGGSDTAAIFWAKTRMGWRETSADDGDGEEGNAGLKVYGGLPPVADLPPERPTE